MANFKDIGVNKELLKSIREMGFETPTPIQKESIPYLLTSHQDLISLAQTGTGKTAAFGLPIIQQTNPKIKHVQAIVLCPTRELCIQIAKDLTAYSKYLDYVKILPVYGGTNIENQIKSIKKGVQIIVGTPGRTKDLIKRKILKLDIVNKVVLDEADEMLSMGFKDDLDFILDRTSNNRQTMLFSATMSKEVLSISKKYMKDAKEIAVAKVNSAAKNVEHHIYDVSSRHKYDALKRIADYNPNIYGIVFCRTRRQTKEITKKFINDGYNADAIHGDLSQGQRDEVMSRFRDKSLQMLIATDVAARGLDVEDLTHIINYSLPDDPEIYTHRSGRTGRAGKNGISIAISNSRESRKIKSIENKSQIKFLKKEVPTGKDICSIQLFKLIEKIEKVKVDDKQIEPYLDDIYKKLEWLSREDLIKHFVSAEFNRFLEYYKGSNNINNKGVKSRSDSKFKNGRSNRNSFVNYSINIGRKKGVTPIELISLINRVMKSNQIEIGKIDIRGDHTIFEMDKSLSTDLSKGIKKINFRGNDLSIEETDDKIEARPSKQKRNRSRSSKNKRRGKSDRDFKSSGNSRKKRRRNRF
ncbi:MAG: DEAD/DEAH box helicase [Flavobacteriaceae bacterium]|jgi:ATP-dependent RNA helicase DeaD|nr:DEAD/DEAH box helicase [Flavobacteriaceae bacterium]